MNVKNLQKIFQMHSRDKTCMSHTKLILMKCMIRKVILRVTKQRRQFTIYDNTTKVIYCITRVCTQDVVHPAVDGNK